VKKKVFDMPWLADVNFLLALFDADHTFHERAMRWWLDHNSLGWATCPLTQNGFVRIVSQPKYAHALTVNAAIDVLSRASSDRHHQFWPDDTSLLDITAFDHTKITGHRQITDAYLLSLAVKHNGRLVTFDGQIPLSAVRGATKRHLVIL
jgi:toxin-antitoxin system PIN domain toxin